MSIRPSLLKSKNNPPPPQVSGRCRASERPLSCAQTMPAAFVTSTKVTGCVVEAFCAVGIDNGITTRQTATVNTNNRNFTISSHSKAKRTSFIRRKTVRISPQRRRERGGNAETGREKYSGASLRDLRVLGASAVKSKLLSIPSFL